jgi:hypothetical protein
MIVIVERPLSIQYETSEDKKDYIIVRSFKYDENTVCKFLDTGMMVTPKEALEGSAYGWYECRVIGSKPKEISSRYVKDNTDVGVLVGLGTVMIIFAFLLGKD